VGKIKKLIRKVILREKASSDSFIEYLKKRGVEVGESCYIPEPTSVLIDLTDPWLLSMGDNITLTHGVIVLTHDYAWSVIKKNGSHKGSVFGAQAPVRIGNNVFVGVNAIITKGVTIGDNVIIGAGSIVSNDCESNSVYAGNPAKKIMSIEEYTDKRKNKQFEEAKRLALAYRERFSVNPPKEVFKEYFMLFCTADEAASSTEFKIRMKNCANYDETVSYMNTNKPMFNSYEEFLEKCYE
jgi:acetyltransferase-like isoleucine patch superfamily enzyme